MGHDRKIQLYSVVGLLIVACGLLVTAIILDPQGIIDNSVLILFGQILTFAGAVFGIDSYKYKLHKMHSKSDKEND